MKTNKHRDHENENATPSDPTSKGMSPSSPHRTAYERACRQIALGNYQKALDLLRNMSADPRVRNAMGVCLLRLGRVEDGVRLLRALVLEPNCTWTRATVPLVYRCNFATALLVSGRVSGCEEILSEISDQTHPSVRRLRSVIEQWVNRLTFWQKLNWWIGRIEPSDGPVTLDFLPGELEQDVTSGEDSRPPGGSSRRAAA